MTSSTCILVFTRDLRLSDNKAIQSAQENFEFVIPLFVFNEANIFGGNQASYLCESLADLKGNLRGISSELFIRSGNWNDEVVKFARECDATGIVWARDTNSIALSRETKMLDYCKENRLESICINSHTIVAPGEIWPKASPEPREFKVFTPYYNRWLECDFGQLSPKPKAMPLPDGLIERVEIGVIPKPTEIAKDGFSPNCELGSETLDRKKLNRWVKNDLEDYEANHNDLAAAKTSHIAGALAIGTLSAREAAIKLRGKSGSVPFTRQLCWRDFYNQILFYNPKSDTQDYVDRNDSWNTDKLAFEKWCHGQTGYPIVDAAMRQLTEEGFMNNRARMVVASFLTKDLYLNWKLGADWFMQWLSDADVANNYLNWQWVAGTGTDTNPSRIFNPIRQSERFDETGEYIRRYIPELKNIQTKDIHFPHHLREQLDGSTLLEGYPEPMIDHKEAITQYKAIKLNNRAG